MPQNPTAALVETAQATPSAAAYRMRRSRVRRARRLRCYSIELRDTEVAELVRRGFLAAGDESDRVAVTNAMHRFLDRVLSPPM